MTMDVHEAHVLAKADWIASQIQRSEAAQRFWQARAKMERHVSAQHLYEELKRKTNHLLVLEEQLGQDHPRTQQAQQEVDDLIFKLGEIPVALQYKEAQDELNGLMQEVVQILLTRLSKVLPVELGPKQGCGKGHDGNGCSCGKN